MKPTPFLKWAGGKSQLLPKLEKFIPPTFNQYIEPFVGGGALFFYLFSQGKIRTAVLLDYNEEIVDCYRAIKNNFNALVLGLSRYKSRYSVLGEEHYYHMRNRRNNLASWRRLSVAQRAAITIYLNKTGYNGLYRVNSRNEFNVPVGRYRNPEIYNIDNLKAVHAALGTVKVLRVGDFAKCLQYARTKDFVYFDPPYNPLNKTSNFTSYTKNGFNEKDQQRLASIYQQLNERGCRLMMSNSDTPLIRELYKEYGIYEVEANRMINCNASKRGQIKELVIVNYEVPR